MSVWVVGGGRGSLRNNSRNPASVCMGCKWREGVDQSGTQGDVGVIQWVYILIVAVVTLCQTLENCTEKYRSWPYVNEDNSTNKIAT